MGSAGPRAVDALALSAALGCALLAGCAHKAAVPRDPPLHVALAEATGAQQPGTFHHVQEGDTLYAIARTYGVPAEAIARENALRGDAIDQGAVLFIPGARQELVVAPPRARMEGRPQRRAGPTQIPRAGVRPLDVAAHGLALAWPTPGVLVSGFGNRSGEAHDGVDLAAPEGTDVVAAAAGTVLFAGEQRGYGNIVLLSHEGDLVTVYAHNEQNLVRKGEHVDRGERIARVGRTGNATGPHLHFEVRVGARPHDPLGFLR